jgi:hypothetical protein
MPRRRRPERPRRHHPDRWPPRSGAANGRALVQSAPHLLSHAYVVVMVNAADEETEAYVILPGRAGSANSAPRLSPNTQALLGSSSK